jgi:tripartite-type tricarboxylate transporter receptor subunit TctC
MSPTRRGLLAGAATLLAAHLARPAYAQGRSGAVRLVVGFPPGGSGDLFARFLADALREQMGRPMIVENRAGAGGLTAVDYFLRQPADGTVMMMHTGSTAVSAPIVRRNPPYNALTDFAWIAQLSIAPFAVALNPQVPARDLKEFVAYARSRNGALSYSSAGIGTTVHLAAEALNAAADMRVQHVPYPGSAPAITDTINGTVAYNVETHGTLMPHHRAGTLRIIATLDSERAAIAPDIPTAKEQGWDVQAGTYNLLAAPNGTPADIMQDFAAAISRVMASPAAQARLRELGITGITNSNPDHAKAFVAAEIARWRPVVQRLGLAL